MWLLLSCLLAAVTPALGRDCEKMKVPFCSKMPYEELRLPNLFGHTTQDEVNRALEPLQELQSSGCFGHYSFILCTALATPCIADVERPAPCRRVCERARDRCYGLMLMYNITESWPDCDLLPKHTSNPLCMMPTSLTPRDNCHCLKRHQPERPTNELMNSIDYEFSIKARMDGFAPSHFPSILSVTVLDIFRDGLVEMNIGNTTFIVTDTSCKCPELEAGTEYLIMGHEDFTKTELLLRKDSYVVPWSDPIEREYAEPARSAYHDPQHRTYSRRYRRYTERHGLHLGFRRPSRFKQMMAAGGAYMLYRHYKKKKKLGKVHGYPGYGGYGSSFGALGGGGYGSLGNPRGKFTNFNNFAAPAAGAAVGGAAYHGYNNYNNYNNFNRQPGSQVPSYPITHKPNTATNKPSFVNHNANQPSYPTTNKPNTAINTPRVVHHNMNQPSYPTTNKPNTAINTPRVVHHNMNQPSYPTTNKPNTAINTPRVVHHNMNQPSYPTTNKPNTAINTPRVVHHNMNQPAYPTTNKRQPTYPTTPRWYPSTRASTPR